MSQKLTTLERVWIRIFIVVWKKNITISKLQKIFFIVVQNLSLLDSKPISWYFKNIVIHIFTDSDHAGNTITRKSRCGVVLMVNGGAIFTTSKSLKVNTDSSCKSEFYAYAFAADAAQWIINVLSELKRYTHVPMIICDNQSAQRIAENVQLTDKSKAYQVRYFQIRDLIRKENSSRSLRIQPCRSFYQNSCSKHIQYPAIQTNPESIPLRFWPVWKTSCPRTNRRDRSVGMRKCITHFSHADYTVDSLVGISNHWSLTYPTANHQFSTVHTRIFRLKFL